MPEIERNSALAGARTVVAVPMLKENQWLA